MANVPRVSESQYNSGKLVHDGTEYALTWKPLGFMATASILDKAKQTIDTKTGEVRTDLSRLAKEWLLAADVHINGEPLTLADIMAMTMDFGSSLLEMVGFNKSMPMEDELKK